jgi:hypothetical protein
MCTKSYDSLIHDDPIPLIFSILLLIADQKKKAKILEDKTFGLKNKNKSKKVQAHIQSVTKSVMNSGDAKQRKMDEERKRARIRQKEAKKAMEEERNALFSEALLNVQKKTTTKFKSENQSKGRDHDDKKEKTGQSRAMKMMFQMDAKEMEEALKSDPNYVPTLEDEVELQRQRKLQELKNKGIKGTPVTEKSFKEWQERKRKLKADTAKKLVEAELKKKKGGKGLSVLSGRDLYEYKKELFKDDDDATDDIHDQNQRGGNDNDEEKKSSSDDYDAAQVVASVTEKVQSNLFLEGDDDELEDLDDLDDE